MRGKNGKYGSERTDHNEVFSPSHYTNGDIECIDAIEAATEDLQGMEAICTGQIMKYIWRWKHKGGIRDIQKAAWYLDKLHEHVKEKA